MPKDKPYESILKDGMAQVRNQEALEECARVLICSYARDPQDVDWSDVQMALEYALDGFGLDPMFPEHVHRIMRRQLEEEDDAS